MFNTAMVSHTFELVSLRVFFLFFHPPASSLFIRLGSRFSPLRLTSSVSCSSRKVILSTVNQLVITNTMSSMPADNALSLFIHRKNDLSIQCAIFCAYVVYPCNVQTMYETYEGCFVIFFVYIICVLIILQWDFCFPVVTKVFLRLYDVNILILSIFPKGYLVCEVNNVFYC